MLTFGALVVALLSFHKK
ncbi:hypothetical protein ACFO3D_07825 [Virgibacillus kekensis]|uniref:Uncharacterized protein n=1 Tax=Virgibacillus kekensis TaxID=202261 RepID=A0ABV9DI93_9BACI